jgi:hypothetical protein
MNVINQNVLIKYTLSDELFNKIAPINTKNQLNLPIDIINQFNDGGLGEKFDPAWTYEQAKDTMSFRYIFLSILSVSVQGTFPGLLPSDFDEFMEGEVVNSDALCSLKKGAKVKLATNPFGDFNTLNQMTISEDLRTFQTFQPYEFILLNDMKPINHTIVAQINIPLIIGDRTLDDILSDEIITDKVRYIKNTTHDARLSMLEIKEAKCIACSDDANGNRDITNLDIPMGSIVFVSGVELSYQNMFNLDLEAKTAYILIKKNNILAFDK